MNACARKSLKVIEPTLQDVFQISADDVLGGPIHRFHKDPDKVEAILKNPLALPHQVDFEFGDVILRSAINAILNETGQLEGYVMNWLDITESKNLKRNLIIKLAELKQSNQDLESFATIASHDLMAPVRKIINFAEILLENSSRYTESDQLLLDKILHAGKTMRLLTDDILEYSRLAGNSSVFERVNLNDVVTEVLATLSDQIMETGAKIQFAPLPVIEANKTQMVQLLQNLISNSLKYTRANIPPVVKILSSKEDDGFIKVCLKDNGMGIKDEYTDLVFQPFERLYPEIEGAGIGPCHL
jgi:light-regulated signal transduction histidine kinase (bacteriophytochrome)